ncbi:hypothetical protein E6W39_12310 [Kitasatospora acidiphila]|uniref:Histone H1-like nucleoprotein HC2 n=1 Tax=Kitasatospora acidiphila TaxID=2567942 RepID=A0A540W3G9_9ACTN|nr:histone H1-like repetitive region-containing protein [Kitasatospora acidiphila]TQF02894.1 hypothetical protein E6W39_12310 [Kitasatospora acidiphila]
MRQGLRQYVELAAGLAEEAGKRVVGTAAELLDRAGVDVVAAERTVTTLAHEVVTVSRGGIDLAIGVARTEAEKAVERVGRLGDQVVKVGVVLEYLEGKLRGLEDGGEPPAASSPAWGTAGGAGRADGLFADDWAPEQEREAGGVERDPEPLHAQGAPVTPVTPVAEAAEAGAAEATETPERTAPAKKAAAKQAAAEKTVAKKATTAKKATATAQKATAKKTAAKKTTATAKKTAAKKTAAKKTAAKKTATEQTTATAKKTAAAKSTAAEKTAAKKAPTRKSAPRKAAPKRPEAGETDV